MVLAVQPERVIVVTRQDVNDPCHLGVGKWKKIEIYLSHFLNLLQHSQRVNVIKCAKTVSFVVDCQEKYTHWWSHVSPTSLKFFINYKLVIIACHFVFVEYLHLLLVPIMFYWFHMGRNLIPDVSIYSYLNIDWICMLDRSSNII